MFATMRMMTLMHVVIYFLLASSGVLSWRAERIHTNSYGSKNLALKQPTWLSSTQGASSNAVDGDKNSNWNHGSCSANAETDTVSPWWGVDLGREVNVRNVVVTNREDCCEERMNNFIVGLMHDAPNVSSPQQSGYYLCGQWPGIAHRGATMVVTCPPWLPAVRYVIITTNNGKIMNFCEVEVYEGPW